VLHFSGLLLLLLLHLHPTVGFQAASMLSTAQVLPPCPSLEVMIHNHLKLCFIIT
jgi:hypothetical protein